VTESTESMRHTKPFEASHSKC